MTLVSLSELKTNPGKYVEMANQEPVYITKNGKKVAKLTGTKADKVAGLKRLFGILPAETNLDEARLERLRESSF
jgi:prevent-host-death family protein